MAKPYGKTPSPFNALTQIQDEITRTLRAIFWNNVFTTHAIQASLKRYPQWNEIQRAAFSNTVYGMVRWWRLLWYLAKSEPSWKEKDLQNLQAIYQQYTQRKYSPVVEQRMKNAQRTRVLRESIPDWLDDIGVRELGKQWESAIASLNTSPPPFIRVNTLKIPRDELITVLRKEGVHAEPYAQNPDALLIKEKKNLFTLPSFHEGLFEVQDAGSQMVSLFLNPKPGMRIVDACAGEGSKTLHLAALLQNKGKIIALDTHEGKLKELRRRAAKAGVDTIETRMITSSKIYKRLYDTADRVLLDVPCSGLGTLRRNPDIKWKLTPDDLKRLHHLQQTLLEEYSKILKPGGHMVYAVCSILPSEGEKQLHYFLEQHSDIFTLQQEKRYWPQTDNTDGFYMALVERKT